MEGRSLRATSWAPGEHGENDDGTIGFRVNDNMYQRGELVHVMARIVIMTLQAV